MDDENEAHTILNFAERLARKQAYSLRQPPAIDRRELRYDQNGIFAERRVGTVDFNVSRRIR